MAKQKYRKYTRDEQRALARWAADCAERVLPLFENAYPKDDRPRRAIETLRRWIKNGVFSMSEIRAASLGAHAAARAAKRTNDVATFAARAAGQAVGTAHVTQHTYGAALYALKAVAQANPTTAAASAAEERREQSRRCPARLRSAVMSRITIEQRGGRVLVRLQKGDDF